MNKKKIAFAISLFVALGLFIFTFANPKNDEEETNNDIVKPTTNEVQPEVKPEEKIEEEIVEPVNNNVTLEAPKNTQPVRFNNPVTQENNPTPVVPTKEEEKEEPTVTYYNVKFLGFNNEKLKEETVEAGSDATAPVAKNVTKNGVVHSFIGWDSEYKNIQKNTTVKAIYEITKATATIMLDGEESGTIDLLISEVITEAVNNPGVVTTNQTEIEGMVDGTLPVSEVLNYKYVYTSLEYTEDNGFVITGSLVVDEEELEKNTVTLTYVVVADENTYFDGEKTQLTSTTYTGSNTVELPTVYMDNHEVHVIWTDSNNTLKTVYTKSETLTATLDKEGPVITLKGNVTRSLFAIEGTYQEEGFEVNDNYTTFTADDVSINIELNGETVDEVDYSVPGTYTITYTAIDTEGNVGTATRTITVVPVAVERIELSRNNDEYFVGDDMESVSVTAYYNNGTVTELSEDDYSVEPSFNSETTGSKSMVYTFENKTATYNYKVNAVVASRIELSRNNDEYFVGDDMESVTVTAYYNNGTSKELTSDEYTMNPEFNSETAGTKSITYTYQDATATYNYKVNAVTALTIKLSRNNDEYFVGDSMETVTVTAYYNNGTSKELTASEYTTDKAFNSQTAGDKSITYTYQDATATYNYKVKAVVATRIELSRNNDEYFVGENMKEVKVTAYFNNGTSKELTASEYTVSPKFDSKTEGNRNIVYTYKQNTNLKATYNYKVKKIVATRIELSRNNDEYFVGENMKEVKVTVYFNNGTSKELTASEYTASPKFNSKSEGTKSIVYTYKKDTNLKATYNYTVKKVEVVKLELSRNNDEYYVNDTMQNVTVTAVYNNGTRKTLSKIDHGSAEGYKTNGTFNSQTTGSKSITYIYTKNNNITVTYNYTVKEKTAVRIELSTNYGKYIVGDPMDNVTVKVIYSNGDSKELSKSEYTLTGFSTAQTNVGNNKQATFTYKTLTATYTYDVRYKAQIGHQTISGWYIGNTVDTYYLAFDIPSTTSVTKVVRYDENGVAHNVNISLSNEKYLISETDYTEIKKMKGNNPKQKLEVTYNVNGTVIVSTYTKVIEKSM